MLETFYLSHLSQFFDVPAGCTSTMSGYEENQINSGYVERANLHQVEQESKVKNSKKKKKNIRI